MACVSKTSCLAVNGSGSILELTINSETGAVTSTFKVSIDGSNALTAISCTGSICVAVNSKGNVLSTSNGGSNWYGAWELGGDLTSVSCASSTLCLTAGTSGQVTAFNPSEPFKEESGAEQTPQPGTTIEYNVPVSGSSAPHPMGAKEVEAWGQKDLPAEGTEVFPEEHPQGWPASGHTGASVYYMDNAANTVNVVTPAGGISTAEYEKGDIVRALTADNREKALKEANPVAAAEKFATTSKYNTENNTLTEVSGPEHKVKLSNGEEVNARNHTRYFYDEGAPENSKGEIEEYGLVTKATDGALLANGEEKEVRTTLTGYSGQEGEGWTLHAPTSTTTEPAGADLVSSMKYNKETGAVEETRAPGGNAEVVSPPEPSFTFGSVGSGNGQLSSPEAVAVGPEGDVWVLDTGNDRVEKFTSSGGFVGAYGSKGKGELEFEKPWGIAVNQKTGNVYVVDSGNNRVEELTSKGVFVRAWGTWTKHEGEQGPEQFDEPVGIAVDASGHLWVSNWGNDRVQEFTEVGEFIRQFGSEGDGEGQFKGVGQMVFSQGMLYVVDEGNSRVEQFSITSGGAQYAGEFGTAGKNQGQLEHPWGITALPATGELVISDTGNNNIVEYSASGKLLSTNGWWGTGNNEFQGPAGVAASATGVLFVADPYNNRISVWKQPEAGGAHMVYSTQFGTEGNGAGELEYPSVPAVDSHGDVWVTDNKADHVEEFTAQGKYLATYGSEGGGNDEFYGPSGIAINQATDDVYVSDMYKHLIQELGPKGEFIRSFSSEWLNIPGAIAIDSSGDVWVTDMADDEIEEFSDTGTFLHRYGGKGSGELQFNEPVGIAIVGNAVYVADTKNNRIEEISTSGQYIGQINKEGANGGEMEAPEGIVANSAGDLFIEDTGNDRIDEFSPSGHYLETIGSFGEGNGELRWPQGLAITPAGDIYVTDPGNHRVQKWAPDTQAVHDTRTIYYSPEKEAGVEACENKPQWAGLPCRTEPVAQPTDSAAEPKGEQLPQLPVVTTEYNMWLQPVKTIETIGNKTRSKITSYEGERVTSQTIEAGAGKAVPTVSEKYSETTGAVIEERSEGAGQETKTISQQLNTLGQLESYTDAEGNATTYKYDQYGRPTEVNDNASKLDHMEAKQKLNYEEATGAVSEIEDQGGEGTYEGKGAGTFKATYGPEGEMTSETYPNNMTAVYGYNSIGEGTSLAYTKNNHCTGSECKWFEDTLTPSIHGEAMLQNSSLAKEQYRYEAPGRLAEVQETPAGEHCTARIYANNEEGDRTSLTTRESGSGECTATEGGTVERHTYDEANRLTDEEVQYEPLGNITKLPGTDAGKYELETEYYADGQVRSQTQHETTNTYLLDPEGRTRLTETVVKLQATDTISHYPGPGGGAPSWTYNQTAGTWSRNIAGFDGLAAIEESGKQAVLQIRDLQGNIVGTASLSETAGKPQHMERSTEYGVPTTEKPEDKYGWLGTVGVSPSLPSGSIVQDGATYVPQLGAALQTTTTPEPAVSNVVTPFVITVPPFVPAAYVEAQGKSEAGGKPGGNKPVPGGEETECTGMQACTASHKKGKSRVACNVKIYVGEKGGWVWSHAYASCPGETMPKASFLQACLFQEETADVAGLTSEVYCGDAVIGEKHPNQLYAHYHEECGPFPEAAIYYGGAKFWMPDWDTTEDLVSKKGWQCGELTLEAYANLFWVLAETFSEGG